MQGLEPQSLVLETNILAIELRPLGPLHTGFEPAKPFSSTVFKTAPSPPGHAAKRSGVELNHHAAKDGYSQISNLIPYLVRVTRTKNAGHNPRPQKFSSGVPALNEIGDGPLYSIIVGDLRLQTGYLEI